MFDSTVNIMDYKAPSNAEFTAIQEWEDKVAAVWKEVRGITYGGPPLRKLIHERVRTLEALRHKLFAKVPMEDDDVTAEETRR